MKTLKMLLLLGVLVAAAHGQIITIPATGPSSNVVVTAGTLVCAVSAAGLRAGVSCSNQGVQEMTTSLVLVNGGSRNGYYVANGNTVNWSLSAGNGIIQWSVSYSIGNNTAIQKKSGTFLPGVGSLFNRVCVPGPAECGKPDSKIETGANGVCNVLLCRGFQPQVEPG